MPTWLRLELFAGFNASCADGQPCALPTRKSQALLAYLAHLDAERWLAGALATFTDSGARFEAARTHVMLAELRAARRDTEAARTHLETAIAAFEAANAPRRVAAARELARSLGPSQTAEV